MLDIAKESGVEKTVVSCAFVLQFNYEKLARQTLEQMQEMGEVEYMC